jgi:hypothetical protein
VDTKPPLTSSIWAHTMALAGSFLKDRLWKVPERLTVEKQAEADAALFALQVCQPSQQCCCCMALAIRALAERYHDSVTLHGASF